MDISHEDIEALTPVERLDLIEKLWESLDDAQVPVRLSVLKEIEGRLETYCEDRKSAVSWEEARARLLQSDH